MIEKELRSLVVECLRMPRPYEPNAPGLSLNTLFVEIAAIAKIRGLKTITTHNAWLDGNDRPEIYPNLRGPIRDIVWDLVIEGVLRPGQELHRDEVNLPYFHITEFGKAALAGQITPYDPDGYLKHLRERVPTVDDVILKYIAESAETLRRNCLLSSTVTLGCASEKAFLLLRDTYRNALNLADQATFDKVLRKARGIKQEHEAFIWEYETKLKSRLKAAGKGGDWFTNMDNSLSFVFQYFRDMRNSAGHPTGATLPREVVAAHLMLFPHYLRSFYDLMEWIDANKPL